MKLISLNTWGGQVFAPLADFLRKKSEDTGIFCFQEIFHNAKAARPVLGPVHADLFLEIQGILTDFTGYYAPSQDNDEGLAIFIKKTITVNKVADVFVHRHLNAMVGDDGTTIGRNVQYVEFECDGRVFTAMNFHGLWAGNGGGKTDNENRIKQSEKLREVFDRADGAKILCGDFNLSPDTQSLAILTENNRNLVADYGITSTRSYLYTKPMKFADYMIVSPEIKVVDFKVLPDTISDHLPLELDFS